MPSFWKVFNKHLLNKWIVFPGIKYLLSEVKIKEETDTLVHKAALSESMKLTGWAEMTCYDTMYTQQRNLLKATTAGSPLSTNTVYNKSILSKQLCFKTDCCRYERPLNTGIPATKCGTCCERTSWTS